MYTFIKFLLSLLSAEYSEFELILLNTPSLFPVNFPHAWMFRSYSVPLEVTGGGSTVVTLAA